MPVREDLDHQEVLILKKTLRVARGSVKNRRSSGNLNEHPSGPKTQETHSMNPQSKNPNAQGQIHYHTCGKYCTFVQTTLDFVQEEDH